MVDPTSVAPARGASWIFDTATQGCAGQQGNVRQDALSKAPGCARDAPQLRARVACRSASPASLLPAAYDSRSPTLVPRYYGELVATGRDGGQCGAVDVEPEPVRFDLDGRGRALSVAEPVRWIVCRRINGRAMHRNTRIPPSIPRSLGPRHHAHVDLLVVSEVDIGAAVTRRIIAPSGRDCGVLAQTKRGRGNLRQPLYFRSELRLRTLLFDSSRSLPSGVPPSACGNLEKNDSAESTRPSEQANEQMHDRRRLRRPRSAER